MTPLQMAAWWNGFRDGYIIGALMVALYAYDIYRRHKA